MQFWSHFTWPGGRPSMISDWDFGKTCEENVGQCGERGWFKSPCENELSKLGVCTSSVASSSTRSHMNWTQPSKHLERLSITNPNKMTLHLREVSSPLDAYDSNRRRHSPPPLRKSSEQRRWFPVRCHLRGSGSPSCGPRRTGADRRSAEVPSETQTQHVTNTGRRSVNGNTTNARKR